MGIDEYPITITSALDLLIHTEGGIRGNQQSTHDNHVGRGFRHKKVRMGHTFSKKQQGGTKENATLVPGIDGTILNDTCYNCHNPGHLNYNCYEAGCTDTCSFQVIHSFAQKYILKMSQ